jgi:hypothetical protein
MRGRPSAQQLPLLALKRAHSASAETPDRKRQFFGDLPFDDILTGVIATLGPPLYVCQDQERKDYRYAFSGRTHDGTLDNNMALLISAQLRDNGLARVFVLRLQVNDSNGPLRIWPLMEAEDVPVRATLTCGWTVPKLRAELRKIIGPWLAFVDRHFSLAQDAGPLAPGQVA